MDEKFIPVHDDRFMYGLQQKKWSIEDVHGFISKLRISYDYTNKETKECFNFEFKHDFSWENLSTRGFHDTTSDYEWFTEDCLTPDELNEIYDRARELEKEL